MIQLTTIETVSFALMCDIAVVFVLLAIRYILKK